MKKILPILIIIIFILNGIEVVALSNNYMSYSVGNETIIFSTDDELDQSQTNQDEWIFVDSFIHLAQSFIPQLDILTRVELLLTKDPEFPPSSPFELAIRDSLTGENLAHKSVNPSQIPTLPSSAWIEFDFDDILVTTGETYYIIAYTDDDEGYLWGDAVDNPYPYGMMHYSIDGGNNWDDFLTLDACFKTYGEYLPLKIVEITGGIGITAKIIARNISTETLDWKIELDGGFILWPLYGIKEGSSPCYEETEISTFILGIGNVEITVTADAMGEANAAKTVPGFVFGPFVIINN